MRQSPRLREKQERARWARTNGNLLVNYPDGLPSGMEPIQWWWGSDQYSVPLRPAAGLSAVTRATSLVCNSLTAMPWRVLTGGPTPGTSTIDVPPARWLNDPQLIRSDERFGRSPIAAALRSSGSMFWKRWVHSALWYGQGYLIFEESATGEPVAGTLRVLNPQQVSTRVDDDGDVVRRIGSDRPGDPWVDTDWDGRFVLGSRSYRMVELPNPTSWVDEYGQATGVLEMHSRELGMASQAVEYGSGMLRSGVPAGYLKTSIPNFKKEQADRLREQWLSQHGGDHRSIGVLNATTEFHPISLSPIDMMLVQQRQMSLNDVANAFGVPAFMLGNDSSSSNTYSNAESRSLDFRQFSLLPWATTVEELLTSLIPSGQFITVDFRGLLRPDTQTRYASYGRALRDGWLLPNEVRALENLPPLPEGAAPGPAPDPGFEQGGAEDDSAQ